MAPLKALVEGRGSVKFKDPRAIANLALQFHGLSFPAPGQYRVQLYSGNELLREARLELVAVKPRKRNLPRPEEGNPPRPEDGEGPSE